MLLVLCVLLVGCGKKEEEKPNPSNPISNIQESDVALARVYVQSLFDVVEQQILMGETSNCFNANELSSREATSGTMCLKEDGFIYADQVEYRGFVCSGTKTSLECQAKK